MVKSKEKKNLLVLYIAFFGHEKADRCLLGRKAFPPPPPQHWGSKGRLEKSCQPDPITTNYLPWGCLHPYSDYCELIFIQKVWLHKWVWCICVQYYWLYWSPMMQKLDLLCLFSTSTNSKWLAQGSMSVMGKGGLGGQGTVRAQDRSETRSETRCQKWDQEWDMFNAGGRSGQSRYVDQLPNSWQHRKWCKS